ncbi:hypothetical protein CEUSTIGMA_g13629.t1 [Chlamydomonas eustigma]|uniref:E3 ubiquitin-protein ligase CCNB1IP1 n=1 Tax=Chlamydomonas eustigma TaxID=1157962 RepID=A0A250XT50_9CHLO|nr:hypothetical protein CEUSTIGMA_g13629.t1 [Chlamydomonas eustigma]|eukprot:GAX86216.1 hypothetical protein CEUSTIGMA_g13629.t1 [Chlamydomonas eustigma]
MVLFGQGPETIMQTALAAINFYTVQQQVVSNYRESKLADKAIQMKDQCNKKLQEVHNAYQNAKRKYQSALQDKEGLEQETKELQEKYKQKAKQNQELQRMFKELQTQNDNIRRNGGNGNIAQASGVPCLSPTLSNMSGGHQMVTTVHHRSQAAVYMSGGGGTPEILRSREGGLFGSAQGPQRMPQLTNSLSPQLGGVLTDGPRKMHAMAGLQGMQNGTSAHGLQQRQQMLHMLPGGASGAQPPRLLPGGSIGPSALRGY